MVNFSILPIRGKTRFPQLMHEKVNGREKKNLLCKSLKFSQMRALFPSEWNGQLK